MPGKGSRLLDHLKRRTGSRTGQGVSQGPGSSASPPAATPVSSLVPKYPNLQPPASVTVPQHIWSEALRQLQDFKDGQHAYNAIVEKLTTHAGSQNKDGVVKYATDVCEHLCRIRDAQSRNSPRGIFDKAIDILNKFVIFEDASIMLPWAAVRFVLINLTAGDQLDNKVSEGLTIVVSVFARCDLYMKLYLPSQAPDLSSIEPNGPLSRLKSIIIDVHRHSLLFLGYTIHIHGKSQTIGSATAVFRLSTIDKYLQALRDLDKDLTQAGGDCEKTANQDDHKQQTRGIRAALVDITRLHKSLQHFIDFMYGHQILSSLKPVDTAAYDQLNHSEVVVCHPETRVDLLQDIQKWVDEGPLPSAYWVSGLAGTGKSTIARTVADKLENAGQLGGSFFFKRGQGDRANGRRFFATIAYQLARRIPFWYSYLAELLGVEQDIASKSIEIQFKRLIQEPFEKELTTSTGTQKDSQSLILVIDAIDECDPSDVSLIIPLLMTTRLRYFFTGRPEFRINSILRDWEKRQLVLHKLDETVTKQDIKIYLAHRLVICRDNFNKACEYDDFKLPLGWPSDETLNRLAILANPLFIAAATICRMAEADSTMKDPAEITQELLDSQRSGLKAVDMIYTQVLSKLNLASHQDSETFRRIVGSIVLVFKPLNIQGLSKLLAIHEKRIHQCLNQLQAILDSSDRGAPIKPFHLSLRDFLLGSEAPGPVRIDEKLAHRELARCCNSLLMNGLKQDICGVKAPGFSRQGLTAEQIEHHLPLELQCACLYWVSHLKASKSSIADDDDTHRLLQMKALMLFEALSWMDRLPEAERMVNELQALTKSDDDGFQMSQLLQACTRFLSTFNEGIQEAPLQVYHSGLTFTPPDTIIGRTYSDIRSSSWTVQSPINKSHWDSTLRRFDCDGEVVECVAFSSDGKLASGSRRGIIRVWSPLSGDLLCKLEWPDHSIRHLTFSQQGHLASVSSTEIRVWDLDTQQPLQTIDPGRVASPFSAVFSDCGNFLYYVHSRQSACVYDWRNRLLMYVRHFDVPVQYIGMSTNGEWLAWCRIGEIQLSRWNDADSRKHPEPPLGGRAHMSVSSMAFSTDNKLFAVKGLTGHVSIWDVETRNLLHSFYHMYTIRHCPTSVSHSYYLEGGGNGSIYIYDLERKTWLIPIPAHSQEIRSLAFWDKHHMIVSISKGGKCVKTWDPSNLEVAYARTDEARKLSFGFGGEFLTIHDRFGGGWLIDTHKHGKSIKTITKQARLLVISEARPLLACIQKSRIEIWDTRQWSVRFTLPGTTPGPICFSTDGTKLAIPRPQAGFDIYDVDTRLREWSVGPRSPKSIAYLSLSTDGPVKCLAFSTSLFDIETPGEIVLTDITNNLTHQFPCDRAVSLSFINGGKQLLVLHHNWGGSILDTATGAQLSHWTAQALGSRRFLAHPSFFKKVVVIDRYLPSNLQFAALINNRHISQDGSWIMEGMERILWLPMQQRPGYAALSGSLLAISTEAGEFLLLEHKGK